MKPQVRHGVCVKVAIVLRWPPFCVVLWFPKSFVKQGAKTQGVLI